MSNVVDFLAYKKKKEEESSWELHDNNYLMQVLNEINKDYPGFFHMEDDTIYITLEENSLKQEEE